MITKNGVCYDLTKSIYKLKVNDLTFVFSSQLHLDKFKAKRQENRDILNYSLTRRFGLTINVPLLADIVLYKRIETRGFLVLTNEGHELWQNNLTFGGGKVTSGKLNE